jgi:protein O-GlcNAc transferase
VTSNAIQEKFGVALRHHQAGGLREADQLYREILEQDPTHVGALHYSGVLAHQRRQHALAADLIRAAIALSPDAPEAHNNLGLVLKDAGQPDQAIAAYGEALRLRPNYAIAHFNLGTALEGTGKVDEAITHYRQAIVLRPDYAEAHNNLGNALRSKGQCNEATASYRQAIAIKPNYAEAYTSLSGELRKNGELDGAIAVARKAAEIRPEYAPAYNNLAKALKENGQFDQAIAAYRQFIALNPNSPGALGELGLLLKKSGQLDEAVSAYRKAIALRPDSPEGYFKLGSVLKDMGQLDDAIAAFQRANELAPDDALAHSNLVVTLNYHQGFDARAIAEELDRWSRRHAEPLRQFIGTHDNDPTPDRRLRIGYVSADFRSHACAHFLIPLFDHHNPEQIETFCYANVPRTDETTEYFRQRANNWCNAFGLSDDELTRQIREDQIDILVDLNAHFAYHRLRAFARKPAPVQVTWLGYPGSTGLREIDYRLSDPYLDPPGIDESVYSEKVIRLPDTFWCYDPRGGQIVPVCPLPALNNKFVTLGSLNDFCKINDGVLALWAETMRRLPASRLLLLAYEGSHRQRAIDRLGKEGIQSTRIEFASPRRRRDYMDLYHRIDIGVDTFPYNGHTTSLDTFYMGVPVVTLVGDRPVSRAGWSQLSNLGLTELAADTRERFVQITVELAQDLPRLQALRSSLRQRMEQSPLMDAAKFTRGMEAAYRQMWRTWCKSISSPAR